MGSESELHLHVSTSISHHISRKALNPYPAFRPFSVLFYGLATAPSSRRIEEAEMGGRREWRGGAGGRRLTKQGAPSPSTLAEPYLKAVTKRLEAAKAEKAAA